MNRTLHQYHFACLSLFCKHAKETESIFVTSPHNCQETFAISLSILLHPFLIRTLAQRKHTEAFLHQIYAQEKRCIVIRFRFHTCTDAETPLFDVRITATAEDNLQSLALWL